MLSFLLEIFLFQSCPPPHDPVLEERKKNQVGNYIIDMERTEWNLALAMLGGSNE